jgi:hypothetical protein
MSGQDPYAEYRSDVEVLKAISAAKQPIRPDQFVDEDMWNICLRIWQWNPEKRPSMDVVFKGYVIQCPGKKAVDGVKLPARPRQPMSKPPAGST